MRPGRAAGYAAGLTDGDAVDWRGLNRANWDDRVPVHLASELYDLDGFRAGASSLFPFEAAEAGDVTGRRLVHLQCHVGLDTLSWARRGAVVTGLDFGFRRYRALEEHGGQFRFPPGQARVPLMFSLRATRPA